MFTENSLLNGYFQINNVITNSVIIYIEAVYPSTKYQDPAISEVKIWGFELP